MDEKRPTGKGHKTNMVIDEKYILFELHTDMDEFGRKWTQKKPPSGS
ncbi:hypothetical protein ACYBLV_24880 [Klebsiella pneumoniae]